MMDYNHLLELFKKRFTPRLVDTEDVPKEKFDILLEAINLAPSLNKIFPYDIFILTNSEEGKHKKHQLLKYFRCPEHNSNIIPNIDDSFQGKEITQPILSGLVFVYIYKPYTQNVKTQLNHCKYPSQPQKTLLDAHCDAMISATYIVLTALTLNLYAGFFRSFTNELDAIKIFTGEHIEDRRIISIVSVANKIIIDHSFEKNDKKMQYYFYNKDLAIVYPDKHKSIVNFPDINII